MVILWGRKQIFDSVAQQRAQRIMESYICSLVCPLDPLGETSFQQFFCFLFLMCYLSFLSFLSFGRRYSVLDLLMTECLQVLCSVEVPVGLGQEAWVSIQMQLISDLSVTLGAWRGSLETGSCDL